MIHIHSLPHLRLAGRQGSKIEICFPLLYAVSVPLVIDGLLRAYGAYEITPHPDMPRHHTHWCRWITSMPKAAMAFGIKSSVLILSTI